jgi:TonB family protein
MFPQPMSRSEIRPDDSPHDPTITLEQYLLAGFPPDLALDLLLNELVVRAAEATHASAAALALARGDEMVCRASTGHLAPDLGVPISTCDGLSAACLQTRRSQLSVDTEFDPRVDPALSRRLGIRSILIVPVFDVNDVVFDGILEVFSASPAAFSHHDQKLLEGFAQESARIRQAAIQLSQRKPAAIPPSEVIEPGSILPGFDVTSSPSARRSPYEAWTLVLGALVILATIGVTYLIGFRFGWLRSNASQAQVSAPADFLPAEPTEPPAIYSPATQSAGTRSTPSKSTSTKTTSAGSAKSAAPASDELVVYQKGKVIFRLNSTPAKSDEVQRRQSDPDSSRPDSAKTDSTKPGSDAIVEASSTTKIAPAQSVWLAPEEAETRLLSRTEPEYPPEARVAHRVGNVVLEVRVAEDGSVSNVRTLSGDPLLASSAADAVRNWRYQPYRQNDHPAQFQTDVTLSFVLPD